MKVPAVTALFWITKILATTVGETAGDALSMSLNLGYFISTLIFAVIFIALLVLQINSKSYQPALYWPPLLPVPRSVQHWLIL